MRYHKLECQTLKDKTGTPTILPYKTSGGGGGMGVADGFCIPKNRKSLIQKPYPRNGFQMKLRPENMANIPHIQM